MKLDTQCLHSLGYKVERLFQEADFHIGVVDGKPALVENADVPTQDGAAPGFFKYQDTNGDKVITGDDRTFIGNPNPKFTYGFNLAFSYKNFDLSAFLYGSHRVMISSTLTDTLPISGHHSRDKRVQTFCIIAGHTSKYRCKNSSGIQYFKLFNKYRS